MKSKLSKTLLSNLLKATLLISLITCSASIAFAESDITDVNANENALLEIAMGKIGNIDEYGSFYIDKNGKYVLAIAKEDSKTSDIVKSLKESLPDEKVKIIKDRKYTTNDLKSANKQLSNFVEFNNSSSNITSTYIDEELGKVIIEASLLSEETKDKLSKKYGDIIEIKVDSSYKGAEDTAYTRTSNMGTIGGGIGINNGGCTIAATAKRNTERFIITAGHCLTGDGTTVVNQNTIKVGVDYAKSVTYDIGLIKVTESRSISNRIMKTSPTENYDAKYTTTSTVTQGQSLCKAGIATDNTCFKVLSTSINTDKYQDQIKVENPYSNNQYFGDSGAPLYSTSNVLYGVMSSRSTGADTDPNAFATATKISYLNHVWSDITLYTSDTYY